MPGIIKARSDGIVPTIQYNGFTFPPALRTKVSPRPIYSPSGRTLEKLEFTVTVECILHSSDFDGTATGTYSETNSTLLSNYGSGFEVEQGKEIDSGIEMLLNKLLSPGKKLIITGLGFGDFYVDPNASRNSRTLDPKVKNSTAYTQDVANGPHPSIFNIEWIANASAAYIVWGITFTINPCSDKVISWENPTILGFDFSIDYSTTNSGLFQRTISGIVDVANWVASQKTAIQLDNVGAAGVILAALEKTFPTLPNCTRDRDHRVSQDRLQLHFNFTDAQIPSDEVYYPGCSSMRISHFVRSNMAMAKGMTGDEQIFIDGSISGSVEVAKGYPKSTAWNAIISVCKTYWLDRIKKDAKNPGAASYILRNFGITNEIYNRSVSFYINFQLPASLKNFFSDTGIFNLPTEATPQTPITWKTWDQARKKQSGPYGYDGLTILHPSSNQDNVVNVCVPDTPTQSSANDLAVKDTIPENSDSNPVISKESFKDVLKTSVTKDFSYLTFTNKLEIISSMSVSVASYLGASDASGQTKITSDEEILGDATGLKLNRISDARPNLVTEQGTGQHYLVMRGYCRRVKYHAEIPYVSSIGISNTENSSEELVRPVLTKDRLQPSQVVSYTADGVPIYAAMWERVYVLPCLGERKITTDNIRPRYLSSGKDLELVEGTGSTSQAIFNT